jgi:hypothetical protein
MLVVLAIYAMLFGGPNVSFHAGVAVGPQFQGAPATAFDGMSGIPTGTTPGPAPVAPSGPSSDGMSGPPTVTGIY